jgi:hypothetical protein
MRRTRKIANASNAKTIVVAIFAFVQYWGSGAAVVDGWGEEISSSTGVGAMTIHVEADKWTKSLKYGIEVALVRLPWIL